jgi:cyclopropane fatty-acyl-phospholipid synthase-like methyltransferase
MDRQAWLAERRAAVVASYDAEAPTYDEHEYPSDLQREWVARALGLIQPGGIVLDAPCGTGKYFPVVAAAGHQVAGVDQSAGMLDQARERGIAFRLERVALQDLSYAREFDAVITVDAMENIPPEDWPLVLANLRRAVRPGGIMYLTVEEVEQAKIDQAIRSLSARGLPAVRGRDRRRRRSCWLPLLFGP